MCGLQLRYTQHAPYYFRSRSNIFGRAKISTLNSSECCCFCLKIHSPNDIIHSFGAINNTMVRSERKLPAASHYLHIRNTRSHTQFGFSCAMDSLCLNEWRLPAIGAANANSIIVPTGTCLAPSITHWPQQAAS